MSHTLHRIAGSDISNEDYVILVMAASGYNKDETVPAKYKTLFEIFEKHNPANFGSTRTGRLTDTPVEEMFDALDNLYPNLPIIHAVFSTREDLVEVLKEIKEVDLGLSVIVSGLVDATDCCIKEAGLKRHSINYSLGVWGKAALLPDEKILQISSMCGHAMISFNLVQKVIDDIKAGKTTPEKAAITLSKPCVCGVFNPQRARLLLEEFM